MEDGNELENFENRPFPDGLLAETDKTTKRQALADDTLKRVPNKVDLNKGDLIRLLSYLEGELQARDVVIATLKSERAKQVLYQAKYGRLGLNDPLAALQRDSEASAARDDFDEDAVARMYDSQLAHLERLIAVQRRAQHRAKQVLSAAERRHGRTIRELEEEKRRNEKEAAQGDDVCMLLEKEREKLKTEMEHQKEETEKTLKELEKMKANLEEEKQRHRAMVLYLMNERKQLLVRLMEERHKNKPSQGGSDAESLRTEKVELTKQLEKERQEIASLKEIVRTQEEDLNLIRQNILAKTRQMAQKQPSRQSEPPSPSRLTPKPVQMGTIKMAPPAQQAKGVVRGVATTGTFYSNSGSVSVTTNRQLSQGGRILTNPNYNSPSSSSSSAGRTASFPVEFPVSKSQPSTPFQPVVSVPRVLGRPQQTPPQYGQVRRQTSAPPTPSYHLPPALVYASTEPEQNRSSPSQTSAGTLPNGPTTTRKRTGGGGSPSTPTTSSHPHQMVHLV